MSTVGRDRGALHAVNSDPLGGSEEWGASKAIQASADGFNLTSVSQRIERTRMNAEAKGMGGTEHTAMFGENPGRKQLMGV